LVAICINAINSATLTIPTESPLIRQLKINEEKKRIKEEKARREREKQRRKKFRKKNK
jgi:hypothetical protein